MRKNFGLAALMAVALSASASAAAERLQYDLAFGTTNPCSGSIVSAPGTVKIAVTARNDGTYNVGFEFRGTGTDTAGGDYRVRFGGDASFAVLSSPFVFPFDGSFTGKKGAPSFDLSGLVQVFVDGAGVPTGAFIGADGFFCTAD